MKHEEAVAYLQNCPDTFYIVQEIDWSVREFRSESVSIKHESGQMYPIPKDEEGYYIEIQLFSYRVGSRFQLGVDIWDTKVDALKAMMIIAKEMFRKGGNGIERAFKGLEFLGEAHSEDSAGHWIKESTGEAPPDGGGGVQLLSS